MKTLRSLLAAFLALGLFFTAAAPVAAQTADDSYYDYNYDDYEAYLDSAYSAYDDYLATSTAAATGLMGLSTVWIIAICCGAVIGLAIQIGITYWVYKDAKKNKAGNEVLWAVITFFTGLLGLLIYALAIRPEAVRNAQGSKPEEKKV